MIFPEYLHTFIYILAKLSLCVLFSGQVNACISEFEPFLCTYIQSDCTRNNFCVFTYKAHFKAIHFSTISEIRLIVTKYMLSQRISNAAFQENLTVILHVNFPPCITQSLHLLPTSSTSLCFLPTSCTNVHYQRPPKAG